MKPLHSHGMTRGHQCSKDLYKIYMMMIYQSYEMKTVHQMIISSLVIEVILAYNISGGIWVWANSLQDWAHPNSCLHSVPSFVSCCETRFLEIITSILFGLSAHASMLNCTLSLVSMTFQELYHDIAINFACRTMVFGHIHQQWELHQLYAFIAVYFFCLQHKISHQGLWKASTFGHNHE